MKQMVQIQNRLINDIFHANDVSEFDPRGLDVYQRNLRATAKKALEISFPTIAALVGDDLMGYVAEKLLAESPPYHGNWAEWGEELHLTLKNIHTLEEQYPYLPDVAKMEFFIHQLFRAKNVSTDLSSIQLLSLHTPSELKLVFADAFIVLESQYPIVEIWQAHQIKNKSVQQVLMSRAAEKLTADADNYASLSRPFFKVEVESISESEYQFISQARTKTIGEALSNIDSTQFSFERWLSKALSNNLIQRVELANSIN